MAVEGCCVCVKYSLFIFNFVFFLGGLVSTGTGIYSLVHTKGDVAVVIDNSEGSFGALLVSVGVLSCILSLAGCLGAAKENRCALLFYAVVLGFLFVLEGTGAGVGYHYRNKLRSVAANGMLKTLDSFSPFEFGKVEKSWTKVQTLFKCCGVERPGDWQQNGTSWHQYHHNATVFPTSCCSNPQDNSCTNTTVAGFRPEGCLPKVLDTLRSQWALLVGVAATIAASQLFGIICGCCLQRHIKRSDYRLV